MIPGFGFRFPFIVCCGKSDCIGSLRSMLLKFLNNGLPAGDLLIQNNGLIARNFLNESCHLLFEPIVMAMNNKYLAAYVFCGSRVFRNSSCQLHLGSDRLQYVKYFENSALTCSGIRS